MNTKMRMTVAHLLSGVLVLMGFAGCSANGEEMYGCPTVKFQVKGKVTTESGVPLKGIQVIVKEFDNYPMSSADTVYSNEKGEFASRELSSGALADQRTYFNDVDGDANGGTFKSDSVKLQEMDRKQLEKGSGWYDGKFELSTTVKLKKTDN